MEKYDNKSIEEILEKKLDENDVQGIINTLENLETGNPLIPYYAAILYINNYGPGDDEQRILDLAKESIEFEWLKYGSSEEFADFFLKIQKLCTRIMNKTTQLIKLLTEYANNRTAELDSFRYDIEYNNDQLSYQALSNAKRYFDNSNNEFANIKELLTDSSNKLKQMPDELIDFYIGFCEREVFWSKTIEVQLGYCIKAYMDLIKQKSNAGLIAVMNKYIAWLKRVQLINKQIEAKKYWDSNPDEKAKLEKEKSNIEQRINSFKKNVELLESKLEEINTQIEEKCNSIDNEYRIIELRDNISEKNHKLNSLGLFAGKEKKSIKQEIERLQKEYSDNCSKAEELKAKFKEDLSTNISEISNKIANEKSAMDSDNAQLNSIISTLNYGL